MSKQHSSGPISRRGLPSGSVLARLNQPQTAESARLAVVADPHIATQAEGTAKLYERSRDACATRMSMVLVSRGLTGMASIRLANFPLVEE